MWSVCLGTCKWWKGAGGGKIVKWQVSSLRKVSWTACQCPFGRKTFPLDVTSVELLSAAFMSGECTHNAVLSTAASLLGMGLLPLVSEKAFSRVFCTGCDIAPGFHPAQGHSLASSPATDGAASLPDSRSITGFLSDACCPLFWQLDHRPFPDKIPDFYKNAFNRDSPGTWNAFEVITAGHGFIVRVWYSPPQRKKSDTDGFRRVRNEKLIQKGHQARAERKDCSSGSNGFSE